MEKISKSHIIGKTFIAIFYFSLHLSFLISLLNPQLPMRTGNSLVILLSIFILSMATAGIALYFLFKIFHNYSNLIFIFFCFLVVLMYLVEKNLHPLFFHPSLLKLLDKGIWSSSITFLGIIFLRNNKRVLIILLIASSIFLYQRRDSIRFRKPISYPFEIEIKDKPKFYFYIQETKKSENFLEELKDNENLSELNIILDQGSRGSFKILDYLKDEVLRKTILTGTYPYVHRYFGKKSNVFLPIYEIDLFPFFFPKIIGKEKKIEVPQLWEILKNYNIPYIFYDESGFYGFKENEAIFFIYYRTYREKGEEFLNQEIRKIKSNLSMDDYFCILFPQKGFFYIKGKDIKEGYLITSMKLVDPIPTILFLYNLPIGNYLSGRVLSECIKEEFLKENPIGVVGKY